MEFKKLTAGGVSYGKTDPKPTTYAPGVTNVNFEDDRFWDHIKDKNHSNY
jgi:hypothetical protein